MSLKRRDFLAGLVLGAEAASLGGLAGCSGFPGRLVP
jgi:hypothetical protein